MGISHCALCIAFFIFDPEKGLTKGCLTEQMNDFHGKGVKRYHFRYTADEARVIILGILTLKHLGYSCCCIHSAMRISKLSHLPVSSCLNPC